MTTIRIILLAITTFLIFTGSACARLESRRHMKMKNTKVVLFWHDTVTGSNPTSILVVPPLKDRSPQSPTPSTGFGSMRMIDNPLTANPEQNSTEFGRAQGFYMSSSKSEPVLLMAMNFAFRLGKYNGSSLTVMGTNSVFSPVRELAVVGGSGLFRLAQGYARLTTEWFDQETGNAVVKYSIFVRHY